MLQLALVFLCTAIASLTLTPLMRLLGCRFGVMDVPGALSIHREPTPRVGGVAIYLAFVVGLYLASLMPGLGDSEATRTLSIVVACGAAMGIIGLLADVGKIPSNVEVALQLLPASAAVFLGLQLAFPPVSLVAVPLTVFYLVGGASSMNLLDGMDGLAAGVTAVAALFFGFLAQERGDQLVLVLSVALGGSALGFLYHNRHPARIFMGDVGSLFLGFTLAAMAVLSTPEGYGFGEFVSPVLILGVSVLDTFIAIVRRATAGRWVVSGDRNHIYDSLRAQGLSTRSTVVSMYALGATLGAVAILVPRMPDAVAALSVSVLGLCLLGASYRVGAVGARNGDRP